MNQKSGFDWYRKQVLGERNRENRESDNIVATKELCIYRRI